LPRAYYPSATFGSTSYNRAMALSTIAAARNIEELFRAVYVMRSVQRFCNEESVTVFEWWLAWLRHGDRPGTPRKGDVRR
jgi:hypothetical protein